MNFSSGVVEYWSTLIGTPNYITKRLINRLAALQELILLNKLAILPGSYWPNPMVQLVNSGSVPTPTANVRIDADEHSYTLWELDDTFILSLGQRSLLHGAALLPISR